MQRKRLYACGFNGCRELNYDRDSHCDHVAIHMVKGHSEWSYNKTIRNLLKHTLLSEPWRLVCGKLSTLFEVTYTELQWDPTMTGSIRHQLEYFDFGDSFLGFLLGLFLAGVPNLTFRLAMTSNPTEDK